VARLRGSTLWRGCRDAIGTTVSLAQASTPADLDRPWRLLHAKGYIHDTDVSHDPVERVEARTDAPRGYVVAIVPTAIAGLHYAMSGRSTPDAQRSYFV
jgi:hypothetical protein